MGPLFPGLGNGQPIGLGLSHPTKTAAALLSVRGGPRADARRYDRWGQALEVTLGELIPGEPAPLLKRRRELTRAQAVKLWTQKRQAGWRTCPPQSIPPQPPRA